MLTLCSEVKRKCLIGASLVMHVENGGHKMQKNTASIFFFTKMQSFKLTVSADAYILSRNLRTSLTIKYLLTN